MNDLEELRRCNPELPLYSVFDPAFAPYGRVLERDTDALCRAMNATPLPETGNCYVASLPELEALPLCAELSESVFGGMPVQAGYCNGHGHKLNALEYHKCSEVNFSSRGLVLLLALPSPPCRVIDEGFDCLVVLEKGTNSPLEHVDTAAPGERKLLWMRNKWLTCHPDSPQAKDGAFVGISGENLDLRID